VRTAIGIWGIGAALIAAPVQAGREVGDYRSLPADLAAAATAYDVAQFKIDRPELERWLADDYVLAGANGKNETRAEAIADALSPVRRNTYVAIGGQVRRVWPNGAVLAGMVDVRGIDHGKRFAARFRFADVWAKRNGRWQVVFTQVNIAR
jgi:hypothetical protein